MGMSLRSRKKRLVQETILAAARRLIRRDADLSFSMKELAEAANVSFVTVYNYYGSKDGVCQALFDRVLQETLDCLHSVETSSFVDRLFVFVRAAVEEVLKEGVVYRAVCSNMTTITRDQPLTPIFDRTSRLWLAPIADDRSWIRPDAAGLSLEFISRQLAIVYRGVFSLWLCREIGDEEFQLRVEAGVAMAVFPFAIDEVRPDLMAKTVAAHRRIAEIADEKKRNKLRA